jgi:hypothetical protein
VFVALANNPATAERFRALLHAIYNPQAVEGSMIADDFEAARMIRENAAELNRPELVSEKLTTIKQALGVVTRRCHADRASRREESLRSQEQQSVASGADSAE